MKENNVCILITGAHGKLGSELMKVFPDALGPTREDLDVENREQTFRLVEKYRPDIIIHAAALVDVGRCEKEKELAWRTNVGGTENLADAVFAIKPEAYFVYISTACVFKGDQGGYCEEDAPYPANFYGLTKLAGELVSKKIKNHLIIRTNFAPREPWKHERAFTDRFGTYLFADDVAKGISEAANKRMTGIVHVCGDRRMSMFELAKMVSPGVKPFTLKEFSEKNDLHLTQDMTLRSVRVGPRRITV